MLHVILGGIMGSVGFYPVPSCIMDDKKRPSLYRRAYGTARERRVQGLPGPLFDLSVLGAFVALIIGSLS